VTVEQELKAALAIEPSPEFVAAVRMRITREEAPAGPGFPIAWLAALSMAAVLIAAADVARVNRSQDPHAGVAAAQQVVTVQTSVPPAQYVDPPVVVRPGGGVPDSARERPSHVTRPEVIVSPAAAEGFAALFAAMRDGRVDVAADAADSAPASIGRIVPVETSGSEIVVPPMTVQVVAAITDSEGARW
jgi:hypothetical protein